jgi:hypothetical protein
VNKPNVGSVRTFDTTLPASGKRVHIKGKSYTSASLIKHHVLKTYGGGVV